MQTKLLLLEDVDNLGRKGEVVAAKRGYAYNFLIPKGFALPASEDALRRQKKLQEERRLIVKLQPDAGEIYVYPKQVANGVLKLLSRKTRKLTKEEAERLLSEKLNEQVTIE